MVDKERSNLIKTIIGCIEKYNSLPEEQKRWMQIQNDVIVSNYMHEVYMGQVRARSESLGVPLYIG